MGKNDILPIQVLRDFANMTPYFGTLISKQLPCICARKPRDVRNFEQFLTSQTRQVDWIAVILPEPQGRPPENPPTLRRHDGPRVLPRRVCGLGTARTLVRNRAADAALMCV